MWCNRCSGILWNKGELHEGYVWCNPRDVRYLKDFQNISQDLGLLHVRDENIKKLSQWEVTVLYTQWVLGPVHTTPFSNENGAILLRIRLLQRQKRSPKTEPFQNAIQSGAIWKWRFLKTLFSSVDGENDVIWKRRRHQNRHVRAPDHSTVSIQNGGQTLPFSRRFRGPMSQSRSQSPRAFWSAPRHGTLE